MVQGCECPEEETTGALSEAVCCGSVAVSIPGCRCGGLNHRCSLLAMGFMQYQITQKALLPSVHTGYL